MTRRAALTNPAFKRLTTLVLVYVLALQALFGAGAQVRVLLAETPGLCTILGFEQPDKPRHAMDACTVHCVGHVAGDAAAPLTALALMFVVLGWNVQRRAQAQRAPRFARAFYGRGPPR
jgi:hypothetical protein